MSTTQAVASSNPFENIMDTVVGYWNKVEELYTQAERHVIQLAKNVLPENLHPIVEKVGKSFLEVLFTASMITGQFKVAAVIYGGVKLIWAISPIFKSVFSGNVGKDALTDAGNAVLENLKEIYSRFQPAIFVACAVGAAVSVIFGTLSFNPSLLITGAFLGILSRMGYEQMEQSINGPQQNSLQPLAMQIPGVLVERLNLQRHL